MCEITILVELLNVAANIGLQREDRNRLCLHAFIGVTIQEDN